VWVGHAGLVGEVVADGVAVRVFRSYEHLGITSTKTAPYVVYVCGDHKSKAITTLAAGMKKVAQTTASVNAKLPAGAVARTELVVIFGDESSAGYRVHQGKGLVVLDEESFAKGRGADTLAHEGGHGIFQFHATSGRQSGSARVPDALALLVADLFVRLATTKQVSMPSKLFNPKAPPPIADPNRTTKPGGHVMVTDTLWAGSGGHPWDNVDEFFASAFGAFVRAPERLQASIDYYAANDPAIKPLAKELLALLAKVGDTKALAALKGPAQPGVAAAESELKRIGEPPPFQSGGQWLLDPTTMPGPATVYCAKP